MEAIYSSEMLGFLPATIQNTALFIATVEQSLPPPFGFLLGLLCASEVGGDIFPRNSLLFPNYRALHPRR
jgi:hypothetical protein